MARLKMINRVFPFVFGATGAVESIISDVNGWIHKIIVVTPNFTNGVTATFTIVDPDGLTVYTSSAIASNTTTAIGDLITAAAVGDIPLGESPWKITCTLSGDAGGAGGTVKFAVYLKI